MESPDERVESLYGQDVDSGHHGSGFPLPLWRRRLLEQHLERQAAAAGAGGAPVELPGYADGAWGPCSRRSGGLGCAQKQACHPFHPASGTCSLPGNGL